VVPFDNPRKDFLAGFNSNSVVVYYQI